VQRVALDERMYTTRAQDEALNRRDRLALRLVIVGSFLLFHGCGGGSSQPPPPPSPTITSVSVSPTSASVPTAGTQLFAVSVMGTGAFNSAVSWEVNGVLGGASSVGTISPTGLYTAPSFAPSPSTVTVSATSVADPTKSGMAQASITGVAAGPTSVTVSPSTVDLTPSAQLDFTAAVQGNGTFNQTVTWSVNSIIGGNANVGTITTSGIYTAPSNIPTLTSVSVMATTVATPTVSGTASVLLAGMPTITSISPTQGAPGDEIQISGIDFGFLVQTVAFSGPNGLSIAQPVSQGSPTSLTVQVPLQAATGPLFIQVPSADGNITNSNSLPFTRVPDLRIRAAKKDLGVGEGETLEMTAFGSSATQTIVWSADQGSITNNGAYFAPASIQSDSFAHVSACIQGTQICDTLLLGLHPFRVAPVAPVAALGNSLQLQGLASGNPVPATWSQITGGGTLLPDGAYTASSLAADGGSTLISGNYQGTQEQTSIGVSGGFPGLVNRVYDYLDNTTRIQRVTQPRSLAVSGTRAYVLSSQDDAAGLDQEFFYIDVYDFTDPIHPLWIDAVEAAAGGQLYAFGGALYDIHPNWAGNELPSAMGVYDIGGSSPVLVGRRLLPSLSAWSFYGGVFTAIEQRSYPANAPALIDQFYLAGRNLMEQQITLPPAINGAGFDLAAAAATQNRLYVTEMNTSSSNVPGILAAYDVTSNPATLLGVVSLPNTTLSADALVNSSYLCTAYKVFDISKDPPVLVGNLPEPVTAIDGDATRILGRTGQNGLRVIDVSNLANPQIFASLFDFVNAQQTGALSGNYVYSAEQIGGLAVYDVSVSGAQQFRAQLGSQNPGSSVALAQVANATNLFVLENAAVGGSLNIYDLQQLPLAQIATVSTGSAASNSVALLANDLYVATEQALLVMDVSQPSQPSQIGSINTPTNALSASGNFLFAGTADGRLVVYNITSPSSPTSVASVNLPDKAIQIANSGSRLLIADRTGGLLVFDVSTPSNPTLVSQLTISPAVVGIQADGNLALLAVLEKGLVIVDVSIPSNPQIVSQTGLDSYYPFSPGLSLLQNRASAIAALGKIAFVGAFNFDPSDPPNNGNGMVYGFDYRQPQHPRLVSLAAYANVVSGGITSLYTTGTSLFVAGESVGLIQADISQPRNTINLFYPPQSLRPSPLPPSPLP
jgi:hypothetical protein